MASVYRKVLKCIEKKKKNFIADKQQAVALEKSNSHIYRASPAFSYLRNCAFWVGEF